MIYGQTMDYARTIRFKTTYRFRQLLTDFTYCDRMVMYGYVMVWLFIKALLTHQKYIYF